MTTGQSKFRIVGFATSAVLVIGAVVALGSLWVTLGDRGIYADATGTAGYTTTGEIVIGLVAFLALLAGAALAAVSAVAGRRQQQ